MTEAELERLFAEYSSLANAIEEDHPGCLHRSDRWSDRHRAKRDRHQSDNDERRLHDNERWGDYLPRHQRNPVHHVRPKGVSHLHGNDDVS